MKAKKKFEISIFVVIMIVAILGIMQLYNFYYENKLSHDFLMALDSIVMVIFVFVSLYYFYSARKFYKKYNRTVQLQENMTAISERNQISYMQYDVSERMFYNWDPKTLDPKDGYGNVEFYDNVNPGDIDVAKKMLEYMNNHGTGLYSCKLKYRMSGHNNYSWQNIDVFPYDTNKDGQPIKYIAVLKNTDSVHQYIDELHEMYLHSESTNKMEQAFIHNISHDIRIPLNTIIGFMQLLDTDVSKKDRELFIKIMQQNSDQLIKIINDSLSLSSLESGYYLFNRNEFDIKSFMHDLVDGMRTNIHQGVELKLLEHESFPVHLDPMHLSEMLKILVLNADKFTPKGSITIDYKIEGELLKISVTDTGIGIDKADQVRIFERFEKVDKSSTGSGLGLCICKAIIDKVGGEIGVESELGKGSTFWFSVKYSANL